MTDLTSLRLTLRASAAQVEEGLLIADRTRPPTDEDQLVLNEYRLYLQLILNHDLVRLQSVAEQIRSAVQEELRLLNENHPS